MVETAIDKLTSLAKQQAELLQDLQKDDPRSEKPIVIHDEDRRRLEKLLARNMSSSEELVRAVEHALTLSLADTHVQLTPYLLQRIQTRAIGMTLDQYLPMIVKRLLEEHAGLR